MQDLAVGQLIIGLLGGLAIFLFGMRQMTDALKSLAGAGLSRVLKRLTRNRFLAVFTGAFVTAVIQSSSITTVLVVGFISAGVMTFQQSVGVIIGANIGTTVTAQIIAFKVTDYALLLVALGFGGMTLARPERVRQFGGAVMGLGLIFLGMALMSEATDPLRTYEPFIDLMERMDNPLLGMLVAAVFTALVQSSSATTGIVIVLASQGFITLDAGIALALGANVGTCVTAMISAVGQPRESVLAATAHLIFNLVGALIWLPFIGVLAYLAREVSPSNADLEGAARLAAETPRQIANAHTIFNVANTLLFVGFTGALARLVNRIVPKRPRAAPDIETPRFLDDAYLDTPSIAVDRVRLEVARFIVEAERFARSGIEAGLEGSERALEQTEHRARELRHLNEAITQYARRILTENISATDSARLQSLVNAYSNVQHIVETVGIDFVSLGRERRRKRLTFSVETLAMLQNLSRDVREAISRTAKAMEDDDRELAQQIVDSKREVYSLADRVHEHLAGRLLATDPNRASLYRVESQSVELLRRIFYFTRRTARTILKDDAPPEEIQAEQQTIA